MGRARGGRAGGTEAPAQRRARRGKPRGRHRPHQGKPAALMFGPFERMIAFRYLRARKEERFVSVIGIFSLVGIALGVATLIIVMSVMNGFPPGIAWPHPWPQRPSWRLCPAGQSARLRCRGRAHPPSARRGLCHPDRGRAGAVHQRTGRCRGWHRPRHPARGSARAGVDCGQHPLRQPGQFPGRGRDCDRHAAGATHGAGGGGSDHPCFAAGTGDGDGHRAAAARLHRRGVVRGRDARIRQCLRFPAPRSGADLLPGT